MRDDPRLEADTVIMTSCIPTLKPLCHLFQKRKTTPENLRVTSSTLFRPVAEAIRVVSQWEATNLKQLNRSNINLKNASDEDACRPNPGMSGH
ncbi:hypothetical protein BDBG_05785 [Blastomyces gilchristii SLH14081]|uniref:Uncharacterized protein n=1 Tax=Blastomyces gilchristii (strain SLH14081) TaxID=559298 RepID=A0A179UQ10_BLAGS|nr:uncharacterized protein BDBG_05785 [Blastomyces gilchristii SLH14081]OAT10104.1 hypothetical protein BDBG_05785 [Blastomyces gilchristii SLH14081]